MKRLLVLAAVGLGAYLVTGTEVAKADHGVVTVGYDGCDYGYGYGYGYPGGVYVGPAYSAPVYVAPAYPRVGIYSGRYGYWGNRYGARYRARFGGWGYRGRYRYGYRY